MFFKEALENLLKGNFVTRASWAETGEYCCLMPGMATIWKIMIKPQPNAGNWLPFVSDLLADDWKLVDRGVSQTEQTPAAPSSNAAQPAA